MSILYKAYEDLHVDQIRGADFIYEIQNCQFWLKKRFWSNWPSQFRVKGNISNFCQFYPNFMKTCTWTKLGTLISFMRSKIDNFDRKKHFLTPLTPTIWDKVQISDFCQFYTKFIQSLSKFAHRLNLGRWFHLWDPK